MVHNAARKFKAVTLNPRETDTAIWTNIFRRKGRLTLRNNLWDDLDPQIRRDMPSFTAGLVDAPIIFCSFSSAHEWMILTVNKLLWNSHGDSESLSLKDLIDIAPEWTSAFDKKLQTIQVGLRDGSSRLVSIPAEAADGAVWNVLQNIASKNRQIS
jgi:hypothetical protein